MKMCTILLLDKNIPRLGVPFAITYFRLFDNFFFNSEIIGFNS